MAAPVTPPYTGCPMNPRACVCYGNASGPGENVSSGLSRGTFGIDAVGKCGGAA